MEMKTLPKLTLGIGDRFARQGEAQLSAIQSASQREIPIHPVWNKSNREHTLLGTAPEDLRAEADGAVFALHWSAPYFVDADHINLGTVDRFLAASDFFTLDVADYVGEPPTTESLREFLDKFTRLVGAHRLPLLDDPLEITRAVLERTAQKFLRPMQEAAVIHRHIAANKAEDSFAVEVSVDETDTSQTPAELFIILAMIADLNIPAQTIAPKFSGRFNKGVDYVGDIAAFEREFDADLAVITLAIREFGLPPNLKISVHSGSDKFSIYPVIRRLLARRDAGLHLKTAGTTWLEEVAGLAESGGEGLEIAKDIYASAVLQSEDLIAPYAPVVDIEISRLPAVEKVRGWNSEDYVAALNHDSSCPDYDPCFRQFMHVSFKVAGDMKSRFTDALKTSAPVIARRVRDNLLKKHIEPLFIG